MSEMPPGIDAYAEEVRRRVEAANDPEAVHSAATAGLSDRFPSDGGGAEDTPGAVGTPRESRSGRRPGGLAALAAGGAVLVAIALAVFMWTSQRDDAAASASRAAAIEAGPPFASTLAVDEMSDAYMAMWKDGSIYEIIPDTDEGRDYFRAFMYSVTDFKAAASIAGGLSSDQEEELAIRERHFLALEDLELTVDITFDDGTNFSHDGHPPARASGG